MTKKVSRQVSISVVMVLLCATPVIAMFGVLAVLFLAMSSGDTVTGHQEGGLYRNTKMELSVPQLTLLSPSHIHLAVVADEIQSNGAIASPIHYCDVFVSNSANLDDAVLAYSGAGCDSYQSDMQVAWLDDSHLLISLDRIAFIEAAGRKIGDIAINYRLGAAAVKEIYHNDWTELWHREEYNAQKNHPADPVGRASELRLRRRAFLEKQNVYKRLQVWVEANVSNIVP